MHGAGARYVLSTLGKVDDQAAQALMTDFYRELWQESTDPHTALWNAKMAARRRGAPFSEWAGWVLTGK